MTALLIDLDGVIYDGDQPIAGAREAITWIRDQRIPHLFLTNTTSRPRSALVDKLAGMGIPAHGEQILTPLAAAVRWLSMRARGPVALFVAPATREEFRDLDIAGEDRGEVAAVVVGDYGERWNFQELNRAFRLLMAQPRPLLVGLGMTRYWKAEDGLRLDTGPFVEALAYAAGRKPVVLGKPAPAFFAAALSMVGAAAQDALMIGDDVRSDVGGAQDAGIRAVLAKTGKFRPEDLEGDIEPDAVLDSIADLPDRWDKLRACLA